MELAVTILLLGAIIFASHTIQSLTGFGAGILALPFMLLLIPVSDAVLTLALIGFVLSGVLAIKGRKNIKYKQVLIICAFMIIGMPLGIFAAAYLNEKILKAVLAGIMIVVGLTGLLGKILEKIESRVFDASVLAAGGVVHGAFGCGGPLVIIYAGKAFADKNDFRASLSLVWVLLAPIIVIKTALFGELSINVLWYTLGTLPFVWLSILIGLLLSSKINNKLFRKIIYIVLIVCGIVMGITQFI